jgi:hypothetical protein
MQFWFGNGFLRRTEAAAEYKRDDPVKTGVGDAVAEKPLPNVAASIFMIQ